MGTLPESRTASPTSVTAYVDKENAKGIPSVPIDDETISLSKRVRFQVDEDGEIDEDICSLSFPEHILTPEDIKVCWYSRADRHQFKADIPLDCRECLASIPEYRKAALKVCELASRDEYESMLNEYRDDLRIVVDGQARGFERFLLYRLNIPRSTSKTNVSAVMMTQRLIRELTTATYTDEEVWILIAEQYRVNAQYATRWALLLAEGDAADARAYSAAC
jgi:hypothetical protein